MRCVSAHVRVLLILISIGSVVHAASPLGDEQTFRIETRNIPKAQIAGSMWRASGKPRGTVFMCHGFARSMWDFRGYRWIADQEQFNVVRFDFREHGLSSHSLHLRSLGYYEIWDLKAAIDWAEANGLEKPYLCYGHSMGASVALRWAGMDRRISGVLAQSPFRTALAATDKFRPDDARVRVVSALVVHGGVRRMLREVDIPAALAHRDDLRVWLTTGERDYFGEDDQRAILAGSASPEELKRLVVIPDARHGSQWRWKGNDPLIREFLNTAAVSRADRLKTASTVIVPSATVAGIIVILVLLRRRDRLRKMA